MTHPLSAELRKLESDYDALYKIKGEPYTSSLGDRMSDALRRAADALDETQARVKRIIGLDPWKERDKAQIERDSAARECDELRRQLDHLEARFGSTEAQAACYREALETYAQFASSGEVTLVSGALALQALREPTTGYTTCGHIVKVEGCMQCALNGGEG